MDGFSPIVILSSFLAVVQLILTMVPGVWYTRKGTVNRDMRRSLSTIAFNLLLPCVVFINIVNNVTASTIASYWPYAMNTTVSMVVGMFLGWIINEVTGVPKSLRYHVIACTGFANLNSLPLMITTAVCNQENMPFYQALGSECTSIGWTYVAISSAVNQIFGFPIAKWLLVKRPEPPRSFVEVMKRISTRTFRASKLASVPAETELAADAGAAGGWAVPRPRKAASAPNSLSMETHRGNSSRPGLPAVKESEPVPGEEGKEKEEEGRQLERAELGAPAHGGSGCSVTASQAADAESEDSEEDEDEHEAAGVAAESAAAKERGVLYRWGKVVWNYIYEYVLMMPTVTVVLSLGLACAKPLKDLFFPVQSAPLGFITGAIKSLQNSYVFVASFVLGAAMAWGPGPGTKSVGLHAALAVVAVRFLVLPIIGCVIVVGTIKLAWYSPPNPVFTFLLLLQYSVPTSNQVQNMASMFQNHEKEIGALIFWEYMIAMLAIPAWMVCYIFLLDKFDLYPGADGTPVPPLPPPSG